jgi:hypothetical protein
MMPLTIVDKMVLAGLQGYFIFIVYGLDVRLRVIQLIASGATALWLRLRVLVEGREAVYSAGRQLRAYDEYYFREAEVGRSQDLEL